MFSLFLFRSRFIFGFLIRFFYLSSHPYLSSQLSLSLSLALSCVSQSVSRSLSDSLSSQLARSLARSLSFSCTYDFSIKRRVVSRAESEECEDPKTNKRVETSHPAKDASKGMRQAEDCIRLQALQFLY